MEKNTFHFRHTEVMSPPMHPPPFSKLFDQKPKIRSQFFKMVLIF